MLNPELKLNNTETENTFNKKGIFQFITLTVFFVILNALNVYLYQKGNLWSRCNYNLVVFSMVFFLLLFLYTFFIGKSKDYRILVSFIFLIFLIVFMFSVKKENYDMRFSVPCIEFDGVVCPESIPQYKICSLVFKNKYFQYKQINHFLRNINLNILN